MLCPYCQTDNRDDRETCYQCSKDISMLRLIVNKAKHHYNQALEHAERGRTDEAITELKNAIDLDSSMAAAHVVLGTLYAQKEQFEEAKTAWRKALALDHRLEKAHEYLNKSEQAQIVFPAIHRLKTITGVLAILLIVGLVAIVALLGVQMKPPERLLSEALQDKPMESAEMAKTADEFARNEKAPEKARKFAEELKAHIETGWQDRLNEAGTALADGDPALALQIADALAAKNPDAVMRASAARIHDSAVEALMDRLEASAADFSAGRKTYDEFSEVASKWITALPKGEKRTHAEEIQKKANAEYRERTLNEAGRVLDQSPLPFAIDQYRIWTARMPELAAKLDTLLDARLLNESHAAAAQIQGDLGAGDLDSASHHIDQLQATFQAAGRAAPAGTIDKLRAALSAEQTARRLKDAQAAYDEKRWEDYLAATERPEALTSDTVELARLKAQREDAWHAFAQANFEWMEARDAKFEAGSISDDEAAQVLKVYAEVIDHLSKKLAYAHAPILFYAASAHLKLGEPDLARELLEQIQHDFPKSYILKSVESFERRFSGKLKMNPPPAAPKDASSDTNQSAPPAQSSDADATSTPAPAKTESKSKSKAASKAAPAASPKTEQADDQPKADADSKSGENSKPDTEPKAETKPKSGSKSDDAE